MRSLIDLADFAICAAALFLIILFPVLIRPAIVIIHYKFAGVMDSMTCQARALPLKLGSCLSTIFSLFLLQSLAKPVELRSVLFLLFLFSFHIACVNGKSETKSNYAMPLCFAMAQYMLFTIPSALMVHSMIVISSCTVVTLICYRTILSRVALSYHSGSFLY